MSDEAELLRAVQREPVVKHVHRELRRAILQGHLLPDSRLVETALAKTLNVSRTPVREAISKLESEGLVRRLRNGGVVVEDTSARLSEVLVLRQALEGAAVRLACTRASDRELDALLEACEAAPATGSDGGLSGRLRPELDRDFHLRVAEMAHSQRLLNLIEEFYDYSYSELTPGSGAADRHLLREQHVTVAHALKARDEALAEQAMRTHLDTAMSIVRRRVGE